MENCKKTYRNALKNEKAIKKAIITLVGERKNEDAISIGEVCNLADISRGTFYQHFSSLEEAIEKIEEDIIASFSIVLNAMDSVFSANDSTSLVNCISRFIKQDESFYSYLLISSSSQGFIQKFKREIIVTILEKAPVETKGKFEYLAVDYYVNGMMGLYTDYYSHFLEVSFEELNHMIVKLLNSFLSR